MYRCHQKELPLQTNINPSKIYSDVESEEQVIQAIYINPELIYQADLKPSDFTSFEMKSIFDAMIELYTEGNLFDSKAICDMKPELSKARVFRLFSEAFTAANINYHARILRACTFNRKCKSTIGNLTESLGNEDFLPEAEKAITFLYENYNRETHKDLKEILSDIQKSIDIAKQLTRYGLPTGFDKLDNCIVGMCPRHSWILAGYTSHGKSTILSQLIENICQKFSMLVFSVEDSKEDKLIRLIATKTGIPITYIVKGEGDNGLIKKAKEAISQYNLSIYDDIYTLEDMDMKIKKHKMMDNGLEVVAIDFIQNIQTKSEKIYDRMSEVAIGLQKMAKKHSVCILGLSQISEGKDKNSISLRGAQEIASSADIVLWIDREPDKRDFKLIIRKNRPFGITGFVDMHFNKSWTGIEEGKYYE